MKLYHYLKATYRVTRREYGQMIDEQVLTINGAPCQGYDHDVEIGDEVAISLPNSTREVTTVTQHRQTHKPVIAVFNKPKGFVVSRDDKHNKTIYELLPASRRKDFYYIGRLDKESHGLMLLTNRPELVDYYQSPESKIPKIYHIKINKPLRTQHIKPMRSGLWIDRDGRQIESQDDLDESPDADYLDCAGINQINANPTHLRITLFSGKYRHIRRLFTAFGYEIQDLMRVKEDKYELANIKSGKYRLYPVPKSVWKEVRRKK